MTACVRCGYDPEAAVTARWLFFVDRDPPSLNERLYNQGTRKWAYRKERDAWGWFMKAARLEHRIPHALGKRRVTLTRFYTGRQRPRDPDNLTGGMKVCLDALVMTGMLRDDSPTWAEVHCAQVPCVNRSGLEILIEELGDG